MDMKMNMPINRKIASAGKKYGFTAKSGRQASYGYIASPTATRDHYSRKISDWIDKNKGDESVQKHFAKHDGNGGNVMLHHARKGRMHPLTKHEKFPSDAKGYLQYEKDKTKSSKPLKDLKEIMKEFIGSLIEKNYTLSEEIFKERMTSIVEQKLLEKKKMFAATMTEGKDKKESPVAKANKEYFDKEDEKKKGIFGPYTKEFKKDKGNPPDSDVDRGVRKENVEEGVINKAKRIYDKVSGKQYKRIMNKLSDNMSKLNSEKDSDDPKKVYSKANSKLKNIRRRVDVISIKRKYDKWYQQGLRNKLAESEEKKPSKKDVVDSLIKKHFENRDWVTPDKAKKLADAERAKDPKYQEWLKRKEAKKKLDEGVFGKIKRAINKATGKQANRLKDKLDQQKSATKASLDDSDDNKTKAKKLRRVAQLATRRIKVSKTASGKKYDIKGLALKEPKFMSTVSKKG